MSNIRFTSTKLTNSGKRGELKPDADGYYEFVIGGLNTLNSAGEYYTLKGAEELFQESSVFMRRIRNGCLKGEVGHPKRLPGMSFDDYVNRVLTIDEGNICCHFREVWLDTEFGKKNPKFNNPNLTAIMAKVKPTGPKASSLENSIANIHENVCFSIRALTRDYFERGQKYRVLQQIISFDNVNEPGISAANKWDAPSLESLSDCVVSKRSLERIIHSNENFISTESNKEIAIECLSTLHKLSNNKKDPIYTKW